MQSSPRIEELRQKFHENPRRYFAPLANEYRKAGDAQQAIAICRAHLAQQPRHMSGHVVYGQALYDAGRTEEARVVFEQALALDPENVIVLRHLGDIARRNGDVHGARDWYSRALDLDPQDAEVAAYVAELTEPLISRTEEAEVPATSENKQSPIITRTLAELYLHQGHVDSALEIYRQLALREPDDPSIRGRIDELARDLEIEHGPPVEMAAASAPEAAVSASSQDEAGQEPTEAEIGSLEQRNAVEERPELELTAAQDYSGDQNETAAPSPAAAEGETQEPVTAEAETPGSLEERHFSETDLSSEVWDADDFWGTEAFAETTETDQIFGLPYDSEIDPEEQPESSERVAGHEAEAALSETDAPTAAGEQDVEAAAPEEAISQSATDLEMTTAYAGAFDEVTPDVTAGAEDEGARTREPEAEAQHAPSEQAPEAQTDAEPQADGDAEPKPESPAEPVEPEPTAEAVAADARELEPVTDAAAPGEEAAEPVMEPSLPATQAAEPLVQEHEPSLTAEAPTWAGRITVREFFATLGSARAPSEVSPEESMQEESMQEESMQAESMQAESIQGGSIQEGSLQAEVIETAPETPAAPEPEARTEEPYAVPDDALARLFADSPVSAEDSRAAAALSGAVARDARSPSADAHSAQRQAREPLPAAGSNEPPQESEEDLRRFREWLDGLTET